MDGTLKVTDISLGEKLSNMAPFAAYTLAALIAIFVVLPAVLWLFDKVFLRKQDLKEQLKRDNMAWGLVIAGWGAAFIFGMFFLAASANGAPTERYDRHFKRATRLYFSTTLDWQWAKGQGMAESGLRRDVCSPVGACGLMQFMPGTARQFRIDPFDTRASIYAAAKYMKWLNKNWSAPRPALDRYFLALGSYNWGLGHMLRAQKNATRILHIQANLWEDIKTFIPKETKDYAPRIHRWCDRFRGAPCGIY